MPAADVAFTDQDLLCFLREEDVEGSHYSWLQLAGPFSGSAPTAASSPEAAGPPELSASWSSSGSQESPT